MAAIIYGETAQRMVNTRQLQYGKTLAILRTWDLYSYRHGFEITCGASEMITRILAILKVRANENGATVSSSSSNSSSTGSMLGVELPVERNEELLTMDMEKALNPANMPPYVARLRDGGGGDLAVAGFVYCSGEFRLWTCDSFASKFFSAEAANKRFEDMRILPSYLFGPILSPNDRPNFYRNLMEYLLKPMNETKEMNMIAETMEHDGRIYRSFVRARYMVLNEGQYACFALSFLPIPGMPSRYGMTASFSPLPTLPSLSSISPLASTNGFMASPPAASQQQLQHQAQGLAVGAGMQHGVEGKDDEAKEKKRARVEIEKDWRACQWRADQEEERRLRHQHQYQHQHHQDEEVEGEQQQQHYQQPQEDGNVVKKFDPRVPPLRQQQQNEEEVDKGGVEEEHNHQVYPQWTHTSLTSSLNNHHHDHRRQQREVGK